jgi:hypothetical protein
MKVALPPRNKMKLKSVFVWLCAAALLAGGLFLYVSNRQKDAELERLRAEVQTAQAARAEVEQAKATEAAAQSAEIARLHQDNEELLRLRNEVRQLREDGQQLAKQAQSAQAQAQQAQAQAAQTLRLGAQQQEQQLQQLQTENQQLRVLTVQTQQRTMANTCINNLRQIDGAKQQWALENGKTAIAIPRPQDIAPYLMSNTVPTCPAGGIYALNAVGTAPTCSIPGHALPR